MEYIFRQKLTCFYEWRVTYDLLGRKLKREFWTNNVSIKKKKHQTNCSLTEILSAVVVCVRLIQFHFLYHSKFWLQYRLIFIFISRYCLVEKVSRKHFFKNQTY